MRRSANFSRCRQYRYALWRYWRDDAPFVLIIGLNPSTADQHKDDPTIRRCIGFARDWGFGGLCVANLFAYRATYPTDLFAAPDPVGPHSDRWLRKLSRQADMVVAAWGNDGSYEQRDKEVVSYLSALKVIRLNKAGQPAHPLYLPKHLSAIDWQQ